MIKRLWTGFWLAVLLVGIPVVLVRLVGNPLPARRDLPALVAEPLSEQNIYAAIAVVAWLIWIGLLYAAVAEGWLWARRGVRWLRRLPRLPLPTPMQGLAGGMLGAVAVTAQTGTETAPPAVTTSTLDGPAPHSALPGPQYEVAGAVELPDGGWLPTPVAEAVDAAAAAVWWRRRRQYRPTTADAAEDGDLAPLPQTVGAVQAALADTAPAASPAVAPFGYELPPRGVGLAGPGAFAAARGALVALLLTYRTAHPRVVTTNDDVEALLGTADAAGPWPPGLHVAGSLAQACAAVDAMVVDHPGRPVTILTAMPGDAGLVHRLAALLTLGGEQGLTGLILGTWPHGTTWHIDADGGMDTGAGRLTMLTRTAATDLLALAKLQTGQDPTKPAPRSMIPAQASRAEGALIRLTMLGPVTVTAAQGLVTVRRTAAMQILVFLAVYPAGATTGELCAAIWPHLRPHAAAGRFYTTVSELRRILRTATGGREVITHTGDRYQLDHTVADTDLGHLLAAARQATTAPSSAQRAMALREVVGRYRGEFAAGHPWPWAAPLREHLRRQVINAYAQLAADHPDEAAKLWHDAARVDPVNEHVQQQAVRALTAAGQHDTAAALSAEHARLLAATQPVAGL